MFAMKEIWKDIKGYEGFYKVSTFGRFISCSRDYTNSLGVTVHLNEKLLKPFKHNCGYLSVCLRKDNRSKKFLAHRIVAETFIPNPNGLAQINHKDENKTNNIVFNLEWCDAKYNLDYGTRRHREIIAKGKEVECFSMDGNYIRTFNSLTEAAILTTKKKESVANISACARGVFPSAYGYKWRFKKNE